MIHPRAFVVATLLAVSLAGAAQAQPIQRGELLVRRHCAACHAVGKTGSSAEPAAPAFRELYRRYDPDALAEALAEGVLVGHPAMPEFRFDPRDVKAITAYLRSIQTRQRT